MSDNQPGGAHGNGLPADPGSADAVPMDEDDSPRTGAAAADDAAPADSSLTEDIGALIDSGRTYAEAELVFQKTRAELAASGAAKVAAELVVALVLLNITLTALAVGVVIALAPIITIWGAIGVVVGVLLLVVGILLASARARGKLLTTMFDQGPAK